MINRSALVLACLGIAGVVLPAKANSIQGSAGIFNSGYLGYTNSFHSTPSGNTAPFSGSGSGPFSSFSCSVGYGYASASGDVSVPVYNYSDPAYASAGGVGQWTDTYTINNAALNGQVGILHTSFTVSGSFSVDQDPLPWGYDEGSFNIDGNGGGQYGYDWYNQGAYDKHGPGTLTIPYDRAFIFGQPFDVSAGISVSMLAANYDGEYQGANLHASMSMHGSGFTVTDASGNPLEYSSTSLSGSGAGKNVPMGSVYSGFDLTNDVVGGHGTVMSVLDGTASGDTSIHGTFVAGDPSGNVLFNSDVVDFKGTNHDKFVLELTYDPSGVSDASSLVLGWKNPATGEWANAVNGNSDGGAHQQRIDGAYVSPDDFVLGDYGVDTVNHVVWAVVDHNSDFAAVSAVPEPGAIAVLGMGAGLWMRRRRKNTW